MTQTIYDWDDALKPRTTPFYKGGMVVVGPRTISGLQQVGSYDAGYWTAEYGEVVTQDKARIIAFRRLMAKLEGGASLIRLPVWDDENRPWPGGDPVPNTRYTDGTEFSDGTSYLEATIDVHLEGGAAQGATEITVDVRNAGTISGGEYFTLGERLHVIREVLNVSGNIQTWWIWPRLRQSYPDDRHLEMDRPTCLMRLRPGSQSDLVVSLENVAFTDLSFVEAFTREDRI